MSFMLLFGIAVAVLVILGGLAALFASATEGEEKSKYQYTAKKSVLTPAEQDFYNALGQAIGHEYRIFVQVHLGSLLDEKVKGQNWRAARAHINRKSVDFILADKETLATRLAIELDDRSHEREDRKERDGEVERILKAAGVPLLRVPNAGKFEPSDIQFQIRTAIGK